MVYAEKHTVPCLVKEMVSKSSGRSSSMDTMSPNLNLILIITMENCLIFGRKAAKTVIF